MAAQPDWQEMNTSFVAYRSGDEMAAKALFPVLLKILYRFFHNRCRSPQDAEELSQATLLKVHYARNSFDEKLSFKTWIFTIANRCLIDHWRVHRKEGRTFEEYKDEATSDIFQGKLDLQEISGLRQDLEKHLATLKPIDRSIVYLYVVEGFSFKEVGEILKMSEGAVKVRAHRSYKHLRELVIIILIFWF